MVDNELPINGMSESKTGDLSGNSTEGCMNCEFYEYRGEAGNYCSEHERYVRDGDLPCKAYVENGSY